MIHPLTRRQNDAYEFIRDSIAKNGFAPTMEEICEALHLSSLASAHKHVTNLVGKGVIRRHGWGRARNIEIVVPKFGKACPHCGQPMPFIESESASELEGNGGIVGEAVKG